MKIKPKRPVVYAGVTPETKCDLCSQAVGSVVYDARTTRGPWGTLCQACFEQYGVGLGTGCGQRYEHNAATGKMEKTAG